MSRPRQKGTQLAASHSPGTFRQATKAMHRQTAVGALKHSCPKDGGSNTPGKQAGLEILVEDGGTATTWKPTEPTVYRSLRE